MPSCASLFNNGMVKQHLKDLYAGALAGLLIGLFSWIVVINLSYQDALPLWMLIVLFVVGVPVGVLVGAALSKFIPVLFEVIKFGVTGVLNTLVDLGVLNALMYLTGITSGLMFSVFKGGSFIIAVVNSYLWNRFWTFKGKDSGTGREAAKFFGVSVIGFLINVSSASLVVNVMPVLFGASPQVWANIGAIVATILSLAWNFVGYKFLVFVTKKEPAQIPVA